MSSSTSNKEKKRQEAVKRQAEAEAARKVSSLVRSQMRMRKLGCKVAAAAAVVVL